MKVRLAVKHLSLNLLSKISELMPIDLLLYATFAVFATFGAVVRAGLGIYKAYSTFPDFQVEWKRIFVGIAASVMFGTFSVIALQELGMFDYALNFAAMFAGLLG